MNPEKIKEFIELAGTAPEGFCIAVTQHNTSSYYGFFELFEDADELSKHNKWRFIPINYCQEYFYEKRALKKVNPDHSIIIDGGTISNLELIRDFSRAS